MGALLKFLLRPSPASASRQKVGMARQGRGDFVNAVVPNAVSHNTPQFTMYSHEEVSNPYFGLTLYVEDVYSS